MLDLVSGRYPSDEFAELRPRVVWDRDEGTLTGRPGAQRLAVTSGGTIPDRGLFPVHLAGQDDSSPKRVGELDEEMVYESRVGDVILLGATSWRIVDITADRVLVLEGGVLREVAGVGQGSAGSPVDAQPRDRDPDKPVEGGAPRRSVAKKKRVTAPPTEGALGKRWGSLRFET